MTRLLLLALLLGGCALPATGRCYDSVPSHSTGWCPDPTRQNLVVEWGIAVCRCPPFAPAASGSKP